MDGKDAQLAVDMVLALSKENERLRLRGAARDAEIKRLREAMRSAAQTLRNLGAGWLSGTMKIIAYNAADNLYTILQETDDA